MPLSPGGIVPRDMNARQWSEFVSQSGIQADRNVKTFTPTWDGFSVDPVGTISYMNFGAIVYMWGTAALTGTSDAGAFTITNLPAELTPASATKIRCVVVDDGLDRGGAAEPDPAGDIDFYIEVPNTTDGRIDLAGNSFTASGTKGLPAAWLISYPIR